MDELKTVTYKQIASIFGVSRITASKMAITTRIYYNKKEKEKITLGQVIRANNLGVEKVGKIEIEIDGQSLIGVLNKHKQ